MHNRLILDNPLKKWATRRRSYTTVWNLKSIFGAPRSRKWQSSCRSRVSTTSER